MRRSPKEKSNILYYIIGGVILVALGFVVLTELPVKQEHVEEVIQ